MDDGPYSEGLRERVLLSAERGATVHAIADPRRFCATRPTTPVTKAGKPPFATCVNEDDLPRSGFGIAMARMSVGSCSRHDVSC